MTLTVKQALQMGVAAHKEGRSKDAEHFYHTILQSEPLHPDANHNLGLLAVSYNKTDTALPLFKTALDANPNVEQFWLSYISALIEKNKLEDAELFSRKALDLKKSFVIVNVYLCTILLKLGKLEEAEKSSKEVIKLKPDSVESHNIAGIILRELNRFDEAEASFKQAISLKPDYADAHNNLGNTLNAMGKLEDAETSFKNALSLKPTFAEAHNNLGSTLNAMGRIEEAEASLKQAISLKPDYAEAHNNLGNTLNAMGKLEDAETSLSPDVPLKLDFAKKYSSFDNIKHGLKKVEEAEKSYRQVIALKPDNAEAHYNLGNTLKELGKLKEAEVSYKQAIILKPDFVDAMYNLSIVLDYLNNLDESIFLLEDILEINKNNLGLKAAVHLAIFKFLQNNYSDSRKILLASQKIQEITSLELDHNLKLYQKYLLKILNKFENNSIIYIAPKQGNFLYVIGESHALVSHGLKIKISDKEVLCKSMLIIGCKQSDLGSDNRNQYKYKFKSIFCSLPESSEVLLAIGEIDCRLDSGIIKYINKYPQKQMAELITNTIENYLSYVFKLNFSSKHNITIQGVPCPNINIKNVPKNKVIELIDMIREFNKLLKKKSKIMGFRFLDVHKLTDNGDGFSNSVWHLDSFHLSPEAMHEVWLTHDPNM